MSTTKNTNRYSYGQILQAAATWPGRMAKNASHLQSLHRGPQSAAATSALEAAAEKVWSIKK
jgi:hypothetical protein